MLASKNCNKCKNERNAIWLEQYLPSLGSSSRPRENPAQKLSLQMEWRRLFMSHCILQSILKLKNALNGFNTSKRILHIRSAKKNSNTIGCVFKQKCRRSGLVLKRNTF